MFETLQHQDILPLMICNDIFHGYGYLFWTLFQALAPMIWFYPLNELEITGYEGFAVVLFSPSLLGVPMLGSLLRSPLATSLLRLLSVASLGSFQAPTTLKRLLILCGGLFCAQVVLASSITHHSISERRKSILGLVLGVFAFISSRVWFTTFVPAWWSNSSNSVVITIAALAAFDKIISDDWTGNEIKSSSSVPHVEAIGRQVLESSKTFHPSSPAVQGSWLSTGLAFGSLLYITQAIFGEVSVISRWAASGYPDAGPPPYPWGALVLIALWSGVVLSRYRWLTTSIPWFIVGCAAFLSLYLAPTWTAFAGGLLLAVYIMSIWPVIADQMSMCPAGRTMFLSSLTWLFLLLFSVWTVAYNFVPGGVYTREHTIVNIIFSMFSIGLALCTGRRFVDSDKGQRVGFSSSGRSCSDLQYTQTLLVLIAVLTLITLAGLGGFVYRLPRQQFNHPAKTQLTVAIWTYHFGYDNVGWPSLERSATLLHDTGADVITLLESDASKPFLGNNDLGMWLGERLGMYVDFGPSTRDHTWGNLILSKYPIVRSKHHLLPSPEGELAPAITATVNLTGSRPIDFVVVHMGNDRDVLDRKLQAEFLSNELKTAENPVVFLGYVTSKPGSRDYNQLIRGGRVKDIDSTDRERWCEYIMYRGLVRLGYARISHGGLSDTEVQSARFHVPAEGEEFVDNDRIVIDPKLIDENIRFNSRFGDYSDGHNWVQKHQYHMSTPKYFLP